MISAWDAGTFLGKTKEISRRLKLWHFEEIGPLWFVSDAQLWRLSQTTFQELLARERARPASNPDAACVRLTRHGTCLTLLIDQENDDLVDAKERPVSEANQNYTLHLMGDFARQLESAPPSFSLGYLKEAWTLLMRAVVWTGREPIGEIEEALAGRKKDEHGEPCLLIQTGAEVCPDLLKELEDAALAMFTDRLGGNDDDQKPPRGKVDGETIQKAEAVMYPQEESDEWCYLQLCGTGKKRKSQKNILTLYKSMRTRKGWIELNSVNAIRQAGIRYAEHFGKPLPPLRRRKRIERIERVQSV